MDEMGGAALVGSARACVRPPPCFSWLDSLRVPACAPPPCFIWLPKPSCRTAASRVCVLWRVVLGQVKGVAKASTQLL